MSISPKVLFSIALGSTMLFSATLDQSVEAIHQNNTTLKNYQKKIDKSEAVREELLNDYKYTNSALNSTNIYNQQLEKIIQSQNDELITTQQQIVDIEQTQKNIFPLMIDMIQSLKILIEQDMPFLLTERQARVKRLEDSLNRSDIKTHEKYRIILEAFKIEYDYAKTLETYQETIQGKTLNILRLGRVALYAQTLDAKDYYYFNKEKQSWDEVTDSTSKSHIRKAIKIAKKQENVTLLNLPFLAQKESK